MNEGNILECKAKVPGKRVNVGTLALAPGAHFSFLLRQEQNNLNKQTCRDKKGNGFSERKQGGHFISPCF